jgi:hypothetical protein
MAGERDNPVSGHSRPRSTACPTVMLFLDSGALVPFWLRASMAP